MNHGKVCQGEASRRPAKADSACRHKVYAGQVESAPHGTNEFTPAKAGPCCQLVFH